MVANLTDASCRVMLIFFLALKRKTVGETPYLNVVLFLYDISISLQNSTNVLFACKCYSSLQNHLFEILR